MELASLNTDLFKYALLALTAPLWWPFLKALYAEMNEALREEGGLLGNPPSESELAKIRREPPNSPSPLVNQEHGSEQAVQGPRGGAAPTPARSQANARTPASARASSATRGAGQGFDRPRQGRKFERRSGA